MPNTISPNMSLILPTVGQEPGPNWALDLNNSLSLVDQHNHTPGSGVQITPAGMDINVDLSFGSNNATSLRSVRMDSQLAPLALGADINCIYVSNGNLYYNDNLGNQVQITVAGAVNGTPGSIGNLIAPAAVTYVPGTQTFVFESNQGNATPAAIDCGPVLIRNIAPSSNYIQIQPPAVLPGNYSLTLPAALPASTSVLLLDSLGNVATSGTATALSVTTLNSTTTNATTVNASSSIAIKNDTGLLQFRNTADSVQFASITGSSSGLTLNLPDTADSYTFQVNGVTKGVINNSGIDPAYISNIPASSRLPSPFLNWESGVTTLGPYGAPYDVNVINQTITTSAANKILLITVEFYQRMGMGAQIASAGANDTSCTLSLLNPSLGVQKVLYDLGAAQTDYSPILQSYIVQCGVQGTYTLRLRAVNTVPSSGNTFYVHYVRVTMAELG